ncbi:nucleotidyltransferase domain-containing protein [Streptomyces kanamyceticus]|uniref:Nucleotidyltransferase domain-containing protein n=1 Tax=Streptomyces kanamyceticus TaxID=1967 RepID=A0A5J6GQP4_STRKN|nr:nucleotidyltransferase domain-containing protein [Streptomyces kanamyceticus]QEU96694.1 nucleotidyltransferase domain-containing protein [Streptomyces kanamyceticus]
MDDQEIADGGAPLADRKAVEAEARRVVAEHFPHALGAVLGGSAAQGRATARSDLDVAVLLPDSDVGRREVIRHEGRVVELFLNPLAGIPEFFAWDRARRRATVLFVYGQGLTLTDPQGHVARTRQLAQDILAAGPPALTATEGEHGRYVLTCFMDDLAATSPDNRYEQLSLADHVLRESAHLVTAHHGAWSGIGRWLPRRLLDADPVLGKALLEGHRTVAERADPLPLAAAAQETLDLLGGPLREGFSHRWPA